MKLLLTAVVLLVSISAYSDIYDQGLRNAITQHRSTVSDFTQAQFLNRTQDALNTLVRSANEALAERGYVEEAQTFQRDWEANYSNYFLIMGFDDIGDHKPLSQWLADFYKVVAGQLGDPAVKAMHLDDINTLNYTIPVVFHPKGDPTGHDHWNQAEYKVHFVPFASIVTYWGSLGACRLVAQKVTKVKRWCTQIASILRKAMSDMIAPKLSDVVYKKFVGTSESLEELNYSELDNYYQQSFSQIQK